MDGLQKLEIGNIYTYEELCLLFGESKKSHHSRDAQKREWGRWFRWTNPTTQKYCIEEIYEMPLRKVDGRRSNGGKSTSKYLALDDIIIDYLDENKSVSCTMPQLAVEIGVLSNQYTQHKNKLREFVSQSAYSECLVYDFFTNIQSCVLSAIKSSLERLKKEKHIEMCSYIELVLPNGGSIELTESESLQVISMENQLLKQMGMSRMDLIHGNQSREYNRIMREKIIEQYDYDINFYYKKYDIARLNKQYINKSSDDVGRLSRKFFVTIGYSMLKTICQNCEVEYEMSEQIQEVIKLSNDFFVGLDSQSWDEYWNDKELNLEKDNKALVFWSQYCLVKMHDDISKEQQLTREDKKFAQSVMKDKYREQALVGMGEEDVHEIEKIIDDLDWTRVFGDEDYVYNCAKVLEAYYDTKYRLIYCENEPVEEYCLYVARLVKEGKQDEQITLNEFAQRQRGVIT